MAIIPENRAKKPPRPKRRNALPICADDLCNLRASGLTDETIREAGLYTENDALFIPYRDINGKENCFARWRPHEPVGDAKYLQRRGSPVRAYFPPKSLPKIRDGKSALYISEGEKKSLCLSQLDLAAIGITGVYCWKKKGSEELIDDLQAVPWQGRVVYLVFDYDQKATTRREVNNAKRRFARALRNTGASVVYDIAIPPGPNGAKQGVDDFIVRCGVEAFLSLIPDAKPVPPPNKYHPLTKPEGRTDVNNATRLSVKYREVARWVGEWDKFLIWDGQRWKMDLSKKIDLFAKAIAKDIWDEVKEFGGSNG